MKRCFGLRLILRKVHQDPPEGNHCKKQRAAICTVGLTVRAVPVMSASPVLSASPVMRVGSPFKPTSLNGGRALETK